MNNIIKKIKIGTRGSRLAMWQASTVAATLNAESEIEVIKTSGDRFQDIPLQGQREKGFFTKEIEDRLLERSIDIAVHSLKDMPTVSHEKLKMGAYLKRASVSDILLIHPDFHDPARLLPLKKGCIVGATSLRRQALVKNYIDGVELKMLRGNVPTRIQKCIDLQYGAIILAKAGVERLKPELRNLIVYELNPHTWLPAPGQGAIVVQYHVDNTEVGRVLKEMNVSSTEDAVNIERRILYNFGGGCHTAFAAYAIKNVNGWVVKVGLEEPNKGWIQQILEVDAETAKDIGPDHCQDLSPISVDAQEDLCHQIQL